MVFGRFLGKIKVSCFFSPKVIFRGVVMQIRCFDAFGVFLLCGMIFLSVLTGVPGRSGASDNPAGLEANGAIPNMIYLNMVKRAQAETPGFDFKMLRGAYTHTTTYKPETTRPVQDLATILEWVDENQPDAESILADYVLNNFPLIEVHTTLMSWYEKRGQKTKSAYHAWMARGLLNTVVNFFDGKTHDTAYPILNKGEINFILTLQNAVSVSSSQHVLPDGRVFEFASVRDIETGVPRQIIFDITAIRTKGTAKAEKKE